MDQRTRPSLLEGLRDTGDQAAWEEFFGLYGGMIRGYARKLGCSAASADDVLQETLIRLLKRLPGFVYAPGEGHRFRSYLLRIAHGCIVDTFRREGRFVALPDTPAGTGSPPEQLGAADAPGADASQPGDQAWVESVLAEAWRRVRRRILPQTAQAFQALAAGAAPETVARELGIERNALDQRKFQVIERLRREVKVILADTGESRLPLGLFAAIEQAPWEAAAPAAPRLTLEIGAPAAGLDTQLRYVRGLLERGGSPPAGSGFYLGDATVPGRIDWQALRPGTVVGAAPDADLRLPHRGVSGHHARFDPSAPGSWQVTDLGSTNGTAVDGRQIRQARLLDGSIIQAGEAVLVFLRGEDDAALSSMAPA